MGKRDDLRGEKENVIVGRLIPAGPGLAYHNIRRRQVDIAATLEAPPPDPFAGMAALPRRTTTNPSGLLRPNQNFRALVSTGRDRPAPGKCCDRQNG